MVVLLGCAIPVQKSIPFSDISSIFNTYNVDVVLSSAAEQLIFVVTDSWQSSLGKCVLLEKEKKQWIVVESFDVVVGKSGLKWGQGVHYIDSRFVKQEGDGAAPAGIFTLGEGFGVQSNKFSWPYRKTTSFDIFVDDSNSDFYNQWVTLGQVEQDWTSRELMIRDDYVYDLGMVINHNMMPVQPYFGSAIFFHVWRSSTSPTLGCTATELGNVAKLLKWLIPSKKPLMIQLPKEEVQEQVYAALFQ